MVVFLLSESTKSPIATVVIRGATDNLMDDIERAIDDGVNAYKALTKVLVVHFRHTGTGSNELNCNSSGVVHSNVR